MRMTPNLQAGTAVAEKYIGKVPRTSPNVPRAQTSSLTQGPNFGATELSLAPPIPLISRPQKTPKNAFPRRKKFPRPKMKWGLGARGHYVLYNIKESLVVIAAPRGSATTALSIGHSGSWGGRIGERILDT